MSIKETDTNSLKRAKQGEHIGTRKTIPELYRSVDLDGLIIDCNEAYANRLGYNVDDVIGMSAFDHTPEIGRKHFIEVFEKWKKTGKVTNKKIQLITKDGEIFDALLTATNRFDQDGKQIGSATILRDISELKWLQDLVMITKFESLYENSPDLYRTVNIQGIIVDCNRAYQEKLGYTKEEVVGTNLLEHTAARSITGMSVNMANWRKTGKGKTAEVWMKKKDGTEFPSLLTPTNLYDDNGLLIGRNVVIKDITELHDTKEVLGEREKIDKLKDEFIAMISHELKTPMTPIKLYSAALKRPKMLGELNKKQQEAVDGIHFNALRLERTVADLLDAQKLELGKMKFEKKEMKVEELMANITRNLEKQTQEKGGQLINQTTEKITIKSDAPRLAQVLTNLINNAIDFVPENTGKIEINAQKKDGQVQFYVKDNGIGMSLENQKKLFQKFFQADTSITRKHGGTGLGLSICKGITEALGGKIWVESEEGKGTNFYFTTPGDGLQ